MEISRSLCRRSVALFDRLYRFLHRLDSPGARVDPILRVEIRRSHRARRLVDGTRIRKGDRIGVLHVDNERVRALHEHAGHPTRVGLEFAREIVASLNTLARGAAGGGPYADVVAFSATTILDRIERLGFEPDPGDRRPRRVIGAYQHALLTYVNPALSSRPHRYGAARRLWMSRSRLLARYGEGAELRTVMRGMAG